jgi:hypothetical protein
MSPSLLAKIVPVINAIDLIKINVKFTESEQISHGIYIVRNINRDRPVIITCTGERIACGKTWEGG